MHKERTVRSFDEALSRVISDILRMGALARDQLAAAVALMEEGTSVQAQTIEAQDDRVDDFDEKIEHEVQRILALRQPMADDLRSLLSCDRISTDLERIADHAKNIAQRVARIKAQGDAVDLSRTLELGTRVIAQLDAVLKAIEARDAEGARAIWAQDEEIDRLFEETFNAQLETMCQTPSAAVSCANALFVDKALERVGDHVTNVAEDLIYWVTGERMGRRATGDTA